MKYPVRLAVGAAAMIATACHGQVLRVAGAADTAASAGSGAALSLYDTDSTTTVGAALQQGVHLGVRREVAAGESTFALGDSTVEMPLPSDLENTPRSFLARGLLLQNGQSGTTVFAGFTGAASTNRFISSVVPSRFVSVVSSRAAVDRYTISTLLTRGVHSNTLLSVSHERNPFVRMAVTAGRSDSHMVLRTLVAAQGASYRFAVSHSLGDLKLQPVWNGTASLERIGLNVTGARSLGRHWMVDGARHSYSTAEVSQSPMYQGVTAARSNLMEGGAVMHAGALQLRGQLLSATSGSQKSSGAITTAAWTAQHWSLQASLLQSHLSGLATRIGPDATRSVNLQAAQQVNSHLRLEENASFGSNSNGASIGGSWTADRFGISVTHHQTFVPFGNRTGFQSVLLVSGRLRLGGNETAATVTSGGGLPVAVLVSTDGYYGAMQEAAVPQQRPVHTPRYLLRGHVRTPAGEPIRGAAVRVGSNVVYTDSEGQFLARLDRAGSLSVRLATDSFLATGSYRDLSGNRWATPSLDGGDLPLTADRCTGCTPGMPSAEAPQALQGGNPVTPHRPSAAVRTFRQLRSLTLRMVTWRDKGRSIAV